jgi:Icc-related predicted phosphoesterase
MGTRIFFATDIHGSERCFLKFINAAKAYEADAIVMGGDITGKLLVPIIEDADGTCVASVFGQVRTARNEEERHVLEKTIRESGSYTVHLSRAEQQALEAEPDGVRVLFRRAITETLGRWLAIARERLEPSGIPIYISAGNDDEPYVDEILERAPYAVYPEGSVLELPGGYEMISCGYANRTPFDSPRELDEDELERQMETMAAKLADPERAIFNFHCPPRETTLDSAPMLDPELRPVIRGGSMVMGPAGAAATRRMIERHQPLLGLHGHVHESRGAQKLGRTLCVNPGSEYSEGVLRGVLAYLNKAKVKGWQFTVG